MPYRSKWVQAPKFMQFRGVNVYHVYKNDELSSGPRTYYFVTNPHGVEDESFDIRDLPNYGSQRYVEDGELIDVHRAILREAIAKGYLTTHGITTKGTA